MEGAQPQLPEPSAPKISEQKLLSDLTEAKNASKRAKAPKAKIEKSTLISDRPHWPFFLCSLEPPIPDFDSFLTDRQFSIC